MTRMDRTGLTRRALLGRAIASGALAVIGTGFIAAKDAAWALEVTHITADEMAALLQMARDIYPHDQVPDKYYAIAVKSHDELAGKDAAHKDLIEKGIADLDAKAGSGGYRGLGWEEERVAVLKQVEETPFFQAIRGGLVVGLYNQKEVWPIFGYEGESYSKGGYIARGFDDIEWL